MRITAPEIIGRKGKQKITVLTAYTHQIAGIIDGEVDIILVGDSLGMVLYGMESTLPVTVDLMIQHGQAVVRASQKSLVVIDMPFGSYQASPEQAFKNASRIIAETACQAVKIEGGTEMAQTIEFLVKRGIPVVGHIGLEPQSFNVYGGYKVQGRDEKAAANLLADAKSIESAGCFAVVLEGIKKSVAEEITKSIAIPTIGIGASPLCDGQVLVTEDMLGLNPSKAKFVKSYADLGSAIKVAVKQYVSEVKTGDFPTDDNCYN